MDRKMITGYTRIIGSSVLFACILLLSSCLPVQPTTSTLGKPMATNPTQDAAPTTSPTPTQIVTMMTPTSPSTAFPTTTAAASSTSNATVCATTTKLPFNIRGFLFYDDAYRVANAGQRKQLE